MTGEPDITELHRSGTSSTERRTTNAEFRARPAVASPVRQNTEVADFKTRRAQPVATSGEGQPNRRAIGTTPQLKPVIYPIKDKTHFKRRARKYRENSSKGCAEKTRYATAVEAHEAIRGIIRKPGKKRFRSLKSYTCAHCAGWHIHSS